ncbi:MAG: hypothetical protein WD512_17615 [Candidatus Paceibacterota bacterium]
MKEFTFNSDYMYKIIREIRGVIENSRNTSFYHRYYYDIGEPYGRQLVEIKGVIKEQITYTESLVKK